MRKLLIILCLPLLIACSSNGVTSGDEQAFISGNGVATYISPDKRKVAPAIQPRALSITQGRAVGVAHYLLGGIATTWSFFLARIIAVG